MKWQEFEKNNSKALSAELREICDEVHNQSGFFCNYCYQREGWYCFPCDKVRKIHEKPAANPNGNAALSENEKGKANGLRGGVRFWK